MSRGLQSAQPEPLNELLIIGNSERALRCTSVEFAAHGCSKAMARLNHLAKEMVEY